MKKIICFLLAALMVCSLAACGGGSEDEGGKTAAVEGLHVGYGQADISPDFGTPLGGYGQEENRRANGKFDPLYATCLAFREGEDTIILFNMDAIRSNKDLTEQVRTQVNAATGVAKENIIVMSTHSHSTPELKNGEVKSGYWPVYIQGCVDSATAALADLAPATLSIGISQLETMNFVRHYLMNDGTYFGSNFGSTASGFKDYATGADHTLKVIGIDREGEKNDIAICNWGAHPCFTGGSTELNISADYVGTTRRALKALNGMDMFFIQAAAGNQNTNSQMQADKNGHDNNSYGQALAEAMVAALETAKPVEVDSIEIVSKDVVYATQRAESDPEVLAQCREVIALWESTDRATGNALAQKYGFHSVYHCSAIISNSSRTLTEDTINLTITRIGDLAFVHAPYEMFSDSSLYIKEQSAFGENTIIATMTNHAWGYFPTKEAYDYGCYESFGATFERGVAEDIADEYVAMLAELKK